MTQIESVIKDVSNVKEKQFSTNDEYEKIKGVVEQLKTKAKELKIQMDIPHEEIHTVNWQKQNMLVENATKKIEQSKSELDQLKKGKSSHQVISQQYMKYLSYDKIIVIFLFRKSFPN